MMDNSASLVYPIADALGMRFLLGYNSDGEARIAQRENGRLCPMGSFALQVKPSLRGHYIGEKTSSVLVKIKKHLFIHCSYWSRTDQVILLLVDWSRVDCPTDPDIKREFDLVHPRDTIPKLIPATVAAYVKKAAAKEWEPLELNNLDLRQRGGSSKGDRSPNQW